MTEYNYGGFINWCVLISLCDILSSMDVARAFQSLLHSNPQCNATHKISTEILYFTNPFFFFQWPTQDNGFCHFWFGVDFKLRLCLILNFGSPSSSKIPSSPHSSYFFSVYISVLDLILSTALASWQEYLDQIMASTICVLPSKGPSWRLFGETTIWGNLLYKTKILTCLQMTLYRSHSTLLHFWYHHVFKLKASTILCRIVSSYY